MSIFYELVVLKLPEKQSMAKYSNCVTFSGLAAAQEAPLLTTALEVVSRASTSSEVLSLNLTNLIILIALKVNVDTCPSQLFTK